MSSRPKPVGEPQKVDLVDGTQHLGHRALDDLVFQRRDGGFILNPPAARFGFSSAGDSSSPSVHDKLDRPPTKMVRTNVRPDRDEPRAGHGRSSNTLRWR